MEEQVSGTAATESSNTAATESQSSASGNVGETESMSRGQPVTQKGTLDRAREAISKGTPIQQPVTPAQHADPAAAAAAAQIEAWKPNYKYRFRDGETELKVEKEIDPLFHGIIKDAATEKLVKELHEKAYGLDFLKPRVQKYQERLKEVEGVNTNLMGGIKELRETYGRGDFEGFFNKLGIPEEKILQWVIDKAQYNQLPPEQKHVLDARKQADNRAFELEKQVQHYSTEAESHKLQAKQYLMDFELGKSEVQKFSEQFDQRAGKPGQFFEAVRNHGNMVFHNSGGQIDLTPEQAVKAIMEHYGAFLAAPQQTQAQMPANARVVQREATQSSEPKVIPNVASRSTQSPTKAKPRSIADLNKLLKGMQE